MNLVIIRIGLIWTQILYWSQFFIVKYIFLEKAYPDSQHFVMNNRLALYTCTNYTHMHWDFYLYMYMPPIYNTCSPWYTTL